MAEQEILPLFLADGIQRTVEGRGKRRRLVGGVLPGTGRDGVGRAGVHQGADAGRIQHPAEHGRQVPVDRVIIVQAPQAHVRGAGAVDDGAAALRGGQQGAVVQEAAAADLGQKTVRTGFGQQSGARAQQHADGLPALKEKPEDVVAEEAGGTEQKDHRLRKFRQPKFTQKLA